MESTDLRIPAADLEWFRGILGTEGYVTEERAYKDAAHLAISALLSPETLDSPEFPRLLADLLRGDHSRLPNASQIGENLRKGGLQDVRSCLANLSGGRWGLAQMLWIPRAVEYGLGDELRDAFRGLIGEGALAARVDGFRDALYGIQERLRERGGFERNWRLLTVSLSFVAAWLGAYDPSCYTFYAYKPVKQAFEDFGVQWPSESLTAGGKYEVVCSFMAGVLDELRRAGLPAKDLIDAQSFVWWRAQPTARLPGKKPIDLATLSHDLAKRVLWPVERAERLLRLVERSRQLLFEGPPGTGKTFVAVGLARLLAAEEEENRVRVVQFHPSYAYEDFIEGIRPRVGSDAASLTYEIRRGVFLDLVEQARQYPDETFVLVIDEMNRANLPRVLGELLYALEYRGPENPFRLPYSGREDHVPENIVLIGTMNSADRSIALVDAAIRRRFRHVWFAPDPEVLRRWLRANGRSEVADLAAERLEKLNALLAEWLGPDRLVGHTYLMREDLTEEGLQAVWEEDIEPVLREHLYNRAGALDEAREVFLGTR